MEVQTMINIAIAIIGALGGWVLNSLKSSIDELHKADISIVRKVQEIEVLVAGQYVRRDEMKQVFEKLDKIMEMLAHKVDK